MILRVMLLFLISNTFIFSQGYICAVGGGTENYNDWSDKPYGWIVEKADSGTIIILSYSDQSNWIPDYFESLGASNAYNKKIGSRSVADLQTTYDEIKAADGVFIKGGDQWKYISYWKGTKTEEAIKEVFRRGGVISGTSAGAMVLSDVTFSAQYGSVYPRQALKNPYINAVALEDDFLDLYPNTLFDTHYIERGRFARLIPFFLKSYSELDKSVLAVGIDDRTAICIDSLGMATVYGSASVSIFQFDDKTFIDASNEYIIENLRCDILVEDWQYNFNTKEVIPASDAYLFEPSPTIGYPKTDLLLTGINQPSRNVSVSLDYFLESYAVDTIAIFFLDGFENDAEYLRDKIAERNAVPYLITLNESTVIQQEYADSLLPCNAIVFLGEDVNNYWRYLYSTRIVERTFRDLVDKGVPLYMLGNASKITGEWYIGNTDNNELAAYRGLMQMQKGISLFEDIEIQPLVFDESDYYENRSASVLWGMMQCNKRFGLYIDSNEFVAIDATTKVLEAHGSMPLIFVDASGVTYADSSNWSASGYPNTRQAIGMDNLRYTVSLGNKSYNLESNSLVTTIDSDISTTPDSYFLGNNYPNPFNGITKISFSLPNTVDSGNITIHNLLGEVISQFDISGYAPGEHTLSFKPTDNLPSGVYIYTIHTNTFFHSKKMVYLK